MVDLNCKCGNENEFIEETLTSFTIDAQGNREEKVEETTRYFCVKCKEEIDIQDCERNGFHNTPAECEDEECSECELGADARTRLGIDCPYVDC